MLIWHDIGRKDSLLSLLSFKLKGCQRARLLIHKSILYWVLACTNTRVLISVVVHAGIHRVVSDCLLGDLRAVIIVWRRLLISRRLQIVLVYRTKQAFLELNALGYIDPNCLLLVKNSDGARWPSRVYET